MAEIVSIFFLFMFSVPCQVVADVGRRMAAGVEPVLDCLHCSLQRAESHCHTVTLCGAVLHLAHRKWATLSTDPATELGLCLTIIVTLCNSSTICWSSNSLYDPKWSSPVMSSHVTSSRLGPVTTQIC